MKKMSKKDKKIVINMTNIRENIDSLDSQIQNLISDRAELAKSIGLTKTKDGSSTDFYRPEREADVLRAVLERNKGPLKNEEMVRLFREIMSACLAQQEPLKVGFLGPEGTFTQAAVYKQFGHSVRALPCISIDEVFQEVESHAADFGVVPIENSTEGTVNNTLDMFLSSSLKICGEIELRIEHHLLGNMTDLKSIKRICAHEQALAQCRGWVREYLPEIELIAVSSNAVGARRARDEKGTAAIGGESAAGVYDLNILTRNIEDRSDNTTRFLVIGRNMITPSGDDKTTILLSADDTKTGAGVLYSILEPFSANNINITRIESRPSHKKNWDYVFFLDVDGHADEKSLHLVLEELRKSCSLLRVLGAYPKVVN
jgi:chorismate mutase/prephenate dehydratase|tara:strand:- start:12914 stop:14032 length:1119 start_codon:yes stop_codon:yes gene_type:complete